MTCALLFSPSFISGSSSSSSPRPGWELHTAQVMDWPSAFGSRCVGAVAAAANDKDKSSLGENEG